MPPAPGWPQTSPPRPRWPPAVPRPVAWAWSAWAGCRWPRWARRPWSTACRYRPAGPARTPRCPAPSPRFRLRAGPPPHRRPVWATSSPACPEWPRPDAVPPASARRVTASSRSSCRSRRPSRQPTQSPKHSAKFEHLQERDTEMLEGSPPEVISGLIYSGSGAGPLMAAASAYANLAAEVSATATQWESIISTLTTSSWTGGGSSAAAAASEPIVSYLTQTAAALEQASTQATASAAAYEAAYAATVPPAEIAANRTLLAHLV